MSFLSAVSGAAGRALGSDLRATGVVAQVSGTRRVTGDGLQPPAALDLGDPRNAAADASGVRTNVTIAVVIDRIAIGTSGRCRTLVLLGARTDGGEPGHPGSYWPSLEVPEPGDRIVLLGSRRAGADIIVDSIVVTAPDGTFAIEGATYRTDDWHPLG